MKLPARHFIPCLLLAALVALVLRFEPFSTSDSGFVVEAELAANTNAEAHLFCDFGSGFRREEVRDFWVKESVRPQRYRIPLPRGTIRRLSIVPTDERTRFKLGALRILNPAGEVVTSLANAPAAAPAPTLAIALPQPLATVLPDEASWLWTAFQFALLAVLFVLAGHLLARRALAWEGRWRAWWTQRWSWCEAHPAASLFSVAVLAMLLSCHPVVFVGKSFASPNNGTLCLYDLFPTVPGTDDTSVEPWNSSDVRALLWAHLPYSIAEHRAIFRDHELPLWLRDDMCGVTLLGQQQSMIGDPLHWIPLFANGAAWAWDVKFLLAKTLFSFGIGLLVWKATRHLPAALLLAFSSAFIGFFSYRFMHVAFFSVSYAPWILLCWLHAAAAPSPRKTMSCALGMIGASWMEFNSGTAKEACMLVLAMNGAGALVLLAGAEPWGQRLRKLGIMAAGGVVFLAVSAPLWLVFLDALKWGFTSYDTPTANQIQPGLFIGLFDDLFYRELMPGEWHIDPAANFFVLIGALWACADFRRLRADPAFFGATLAALPLGALVFGVVPHQWITALPLLKNIWHVDNTFSCPLIILLFVLAGFGFRSCAEKMASRETWLADWRRTLVFLAVLVALYLGCVNAQARWPMFAVQVTRLFTPSPFFLGYAGALLAAGVALPLAARALAVGSGSKVVFGTIAVLGFFAVHFRHGMWLETKFDYYVMNPRERMDLQAHSPAVDHVLARQTEPSRVGSFGQVLRPGYNVVYGLETCTGADAVANRWFAEWLEGNGLPGSWMWESNYPKELLPALRPFYDAMNVRYYLGALENQSHPAPGLKKVAVADLEIFESPSAWPRAFFTDRVSRYQKPAELGEWIAHGDGRPLAGMQDASALVMSLGADQATRLIVPAANYRLTSNSTAFTVDAPGAGLAVLTEAYEEGSFRVRVNGAPASCLRVNHCFKGVFLPGPGHYAITFTYWPRLLTPALWAAGAGFVILLAAIFWFLRTRNAPVA